MAPNKAMLTLKLKVCSTAPTQKTHVFKKVQSKVSIKINFA